MQVQLKALENYRKAAEDYARSYRESNILVGQLADQKKLSRDAAFAGEAGTAGSRGTLGMAPAGEAQEYPERYVAASEAFGKCAKAIHAENNDHASTVGPTTALRANAVAFNPLLGYNGIGSNNTGSNTSGNSSSEQYSTASSGIPNMNTNSSGYYHMNEAAEYWSRRGTYPTAATTAKASPKKAPKGPGKPRAKSRENIVGYQCRRQTYEYLQNV